jgi:hypothetical protein
LQRLVFRRQGGRQRRLNRAYLKNAHTGLFGRGAVSPGQLALSRYCCLVTNSCFLGTPRRHR